MIPEAGIIGLVSVGSELQAPVAKPYGRAGDDGKQRGEEEPQALMLGSLLQNRDGNVRWRYGSSG